MKKTLTFWSKPIEPALHAAIALHYLAIGESCKSLPYQFRVAPKTISSNLPETCKATVAASGDEVMQTPEEWKEVVRGLEERWNFPYTLGEIDGKYIHIQISDFGGTHFFDYRKYSFILLEVIVVEC
ncbi:uncharacterized protein LOC135209045 [Macrobrachium nipponense]|uniref:uncharacterized protein LOC135209045 n=1 Tax=Macrobrachium nipponense TaxID=159736 RepID=UPI0030C7C1F3